MVGACVGHWLRRLRLKALAAGLFAAGPLVSLGCSTLALGLDDPDWDRVQPVCAAPAPRASSRPAADAAGVARASYRPGPAPPEKLPDAEQRPPAATKEVPVNLDAVLRLAQEQNAEVRLAREKVHESELKNEAAQGCLPPLTPRIAAERLAAEGEVWRRKAELSRTLADKQIDAAGAYFDLLTARRAVAVNRELERQQQEVLSKAEAFFKDLGKPIEVVVESTRAELNGRRQSLIDLRQKADGAAARLGYLLALPTDARPLPLDAEPAPVDLTPDATLPEEELVARTLSRGPGVQELEALLATIDRGLEHIKGLLGGANVREQVLSKRQQVELNLEDLRGGLAAKVKEARSAVLEGREQIRELGEQIKHTHAAYQLSRQRFESTPLLVFFEMLQSIRALERAHLGYLTAVAAYNKAQVRLLVLLGGGCAAH